LRDEAVTYEVALEPEPEILGEFEAWLEYHVDDVIALPGFTGATIHKAEDPESGAALRVVRYQLADRRALDRYLEEHAPRMRAEGLAKFGNRFRATRRVVLEGRDAALTDARPCPNCGELLWGQYCAACGQRARVRMITFWELLKDAGDLLASLDSRIWRTLGLLMFRPGRLTLDYLQGKRARYVPPARLFIASSIVFFFLATLNARLEFNEGGGFVFDPEPTVPTENAESAGGSEGTDRVAPDEPEVEVGAGVRVDRDCNISYSGVPEWLERLVPRERAVEICQRITADRGQSFARAILGNIPAMMFLFLPLMGLVMKLAYPLSGRYYAEHLLFLVHFHSFFFITNIGLIALRWGAETAAPGVLPLTGVTIAAYVYMPIYLFRAMRRVYGQGILATAFKYLLLGGAYLVALMFTLLGVILYTAVTL
jgi:hypothetical protein